MTDKTSLPGAADLTDERCQQLARDLTARFGTPLLSSNEIRAFAGELAALSGSPQPQPVAEQYAKCYVCDRPMDGKSEDDCHCFHRKELAPSVEPVAVKEAKPVIYVDQGGALHSSVSKEQVEAILGPHIDHIRFHLATPQAAPKAEPPLKVTACYFPDAGEADLSWERGAKKVGLTVKVTHKQGIELAAVVWPCIEWDATSKALATPHTGVEGVSEERLDEIMRVCMQIANRYAFVGDAAFPRGREKLRAVLAAQPVAGHQGGEHV
jgi:hypothetical protein